MKNKFYIYIIILFALITLAIVVNKVSGSDTAKDKIEQLDELVLDAEELSTHDRVEEIIITDGSTYGKLMTEAGIDPNVYINIYEAAADIYDLASIRVGRVLNLKFDKDTDTFKELMYQVDFENELYVRLENIEVTAELDDSTTATTTQMVWRAELVPIDYNIEIVTDNGTVDSSMYQAALDSGIDERVIVELANAFQWSVDFSMEVQKGDTFKFTYEKLYRDGEYVGPGQILAGKFVNKDVGLYVFYFEESEDNQGFFDEAGNSVQKMFLKAPVAFKYISSGFTTGLRYVEAFNVSTGHRAIDYAAALGTPVRAVGNGTIMFAGWDGPYGNKISVKHNATYSTNYCHLSKFAVKSGQRVNQGDVIGYVGSTGFSTGPHLHYEMMKNGVKINPLLEVLPPGTPIKDENKDRFFAAINPLRIVLDE